MKRLLLIILLCAVIVSSRKYLKHPHFAKLVTAPGCGFRDQNPGVHKFIHYFAGFIADLEWDLLPCENPYIQFYDLAYNEMERVELDKHTAEEVFEIFRKRRFWKTSNRIWLSNPGPWENHQAPVCEVDPFEGFTPVVEDATGTCVDGICD